MEARWMVYPYHFFLVCRYMHFALFLSWFVMHIDMFLLPDSLFVMFLLVLSVGNGEECH